jgi:hypothetical protein
MRYKSDSQDSEGDSSKRARQVLGATLAAVMLGFLVIYLTGCKTVPETQTIRIEPPERYTQPCPVPAPEGDTVAYVIEQYVPVLQQALHGCNQDKARIREWAAGGDE